MKNHVPLQQGMKSHEQDSLGDDFFEEADADVTGPTEEPWKDKGNVKLLFTEDLPQFRRSITSKRAVLCPLVPT